MSDSQKSSSLEQQELEKYVFSEMESLLNVKLLNNPKIPLADGVHIEPDIYSEDPPVAGEIFAHQGKMKGGQNHKVAQDILKLLLLDKVKDREYQKYIVVCDTAIEKALSGNSALAESIRQFGINLVRIDLPDELKEMVIDAQKRQIMING